MLNIGRIQEGEKNPCLSDLQAEMCTMEPRVQERVEINFIAISTLLTVKAIGTDELYSGKVKKSARD